MMERITNCSVAYTLEERQLIEDGLEMGLSVTEIQKLSGRSKYSIYREINKNGGKKLYCAETAHKTAVSRAVGSNRRGLSLEDRYTIEQMLKDRCPNVQICFKLNRHRQMIDKEIKLNGGRELYNAEEAHKKKDLSKIDGCFQENKPRQLTLQYLYDEIQNLKMQVEILVETLIERDNGT